MYWQQLREIAEPATEIVPRKEQKSKQKWMTAEFLNLMDGRRIAKKGQDATKYQEKNGLYERSALKQKKHDLMKGARR